VAEGGADRSATVVALISAEALVSESDELPDQRIVARVVQLLRDVERATPQGAGLHTQLDTVAKWVGLLARPDEHERFGGSAQVRSHVTMQFRLAVAAAEDYVRATGWPAPQRESD
jgi:hypothetical protein